MASTVKERARIKAALVLVILGTLLQVVCLYKVVPATFLGFALVAAPLVAGGIVVFLVTVWRITKRRFEG